MCCLLRRVRRCLKLKGKGKVDRGGERKRDKEGEKESEREEEDEGEKRG